MKHAATTDAKSHLGKVIGKNPKKPLPCLRDIMFFFFDH